MYKDKKILAIITARGNSKRLPGKNIKPFLGKPLIAWTIKEAKRSKYIDRVIVSTDSGKIAQISKKYGAEAPFMRPKRIASDTADSNSVIMHALSWIKKNEENSPYDYFILLQPTSPLRKAKHINEAIIKIIDHPRADALVSVYEATNMSVLGRIGAKGYLKHIRSKCNRKLFVINGAIYISKAAFFIEYRDFYKRNCLSFIMDKKDSVDIDTLADWNYAEYLAKNY